MKPKTFKCPHCETECRKIYKNGILVIQDKYLHIPKINKFVWENHDCDEFLEKDE